MKPTRPSIEATEKCAPNNGVAMLNFLASLANDPLESLRDKRIKVAAQLSALLAALKLSHAKVAEKAHMKRPQLSRQLSGDVNLTLDTITRICEAAGADFDVVFRKRSAPALKQFWEPDSEDLIRVVETTDLRSEYFKTKVERFHAQNAQLQTSIWREILGPASTAYRMDVLDINGQAGCVSILTEKAANEGGNYEPTQPIAA